MSHADGKGKNVPVLRSIHLQLYVRLTSDAVVSKYLKRYGLNISEQSQYAATSPNSLQPRILLFLKCHAEKDNENRSKGQRLGNPSSLMLNKILKQAKFSRTCGKIELALALYFSFNLQESTNKLTASWKRFCSPLFYTYPFMLRLFVVCLHSWQYTSSLKSGYLWQVCKTKQTHSKCCTSNFMITGTFCFSWI